MRKWIQFWLLLRILTHARTKEGSAMLSIASLIREGVIDYFHF